MRDHPLHVLVVEDDADDAFLIEDCLQEGLRESRPQVDHAPSVDEALSRLERAPYDLMLVDYRLGSEDGLAFLRESRSRGVETPAIMLTGQGGEEVAVEAMKAGAADYLAKSKLRPAPLASAIHHALELAQARRLQSEAEEALKESEDRYRRIVETAQEGIWVVDAECRTTYANRRLAEMLGTSVDDLLGHSLYEFLAPSSYANLRVDLDSLVAAAGKSQGVVFQRPNGSLVRATIAASSMHGIARDPYGERVFVVRLQETRAAERERLEPLGPETNSQIAALLAQRFGGILAGIFGWSHLELSRSAEHGPARRSLEAIRYEAQRGASLVRKLRAFSGDLLGKPRVLYLNGILANLKGTLTQIAGPGCEVVLELAEDLGPVYADPDQVREAIGSLVDCASEKLANGGVLTLRTSNVDLAEPLAGPCTRLAPGPYAVLDVTTTRAGWPEHVKGVLYEPFHPSENEEPGDLLELASVFGLVRQWGGGMEQAAGKWGAAFRLYIPKSFARAEVDPSGSILGEGKSA